MVQGGIYLHRRWSLRSFLFDSLLLCKWGNEQKDISNYPVSDFVTCSFHRNLSTFKPSMSAESQSQKVNVHLLVHTLGYCFSLCISVDIYFLFLYFVWQWVAPIQWWCLCWSYKRGGRWGRCWMLCWYRCYQWQVIWG